jgi:hypothetical protein
MSLEQCETCRLSLVTVEYDAAGGEVGGYACQIDLSEHFNAAHCPYHVSWDTTLPPPARSCKKSAGKGINGCSTGGCGTGGCGSCSTESEDEEKFDPEAEMDPPEAMLLPWDEIRQAVRSGLYERMDDPRGKHEDDHVDEHEGHEEHEEHAEHADSGCGSCGALKALDKWDLGRDANAPVPQPFADDDEDEPQP